MVKHEVVLDGAVLGAKLDRKRHHAMVADADYQQTITRIVSRSKMGGAPSMSQPRWT